MKIWTIDFTTGHPHWSFADIEAETAEEAKAVLKDLLQSENDTVWKDELLPEEEWKITEAQRPYRFILGSGCR